MSVDNGWVLVQNRSLVLTSSLINDSTDDAAKWTNLHSMISHPRKAHASYRRNKFNLAYGINPQTDTSIQNTYLRWRCMFLLIFSKVKKADYVSIWWWERWPPWRHPRHSVRSSWREVDGGVRIALSTAPKPIGIPIFVFETPLDSKNPQRKFFTLRIS